MPEISFFLSVIPVSCTKIDLARNSEKIKKGPKQRNTRKGKEVERKKPKQREKDRPKGQTNKKKRPRREIKSTQVPERERQT